jgi:hypothetical protein
MLFKDPPSIEIGDDENDEEMAPSGGEKSGFAGSIPGGFFLEFFVIAGLAALISWICLLIDGRWPSVFPIAIDYAYFLSFGVLVLLYAYVYQMNHMYNNMLSAAAVLVSTATNYAQISEVERLLFGGRSQGDSLSGQMSDSPKQRKATARLLAAVHQLDSPVLHRIVQFCVYFQALALPWGLWFTFQWFTVLVVPMVMVPFLLARQYASKLRYKARLSNRYSKAWSAPNAVVSSGRTAVSKTFVKK